ncbi:MAG: hypothetical protein K9J25_05505 [Bacteroidales bacterium]|nr:hypothetical protein [Bacteroidales bacterium]
MKTDESLKSSWAKYNDRLDRMESFNREMLIRIISKQKSGVLTDMKRRSLFGLLLSPIIFSVVILPFAIQGGFTIIQIVGIILSGLLLAYYAWHSFRYLRLLNSLNLENDSLLENKKKIISIKKFVNQFHKNRILSVPLLMLGVLLVIEYIFPLNTLIYVLISVTSIVALYFWGRHKATLLFTNRINEVEEGLNEINQIID